MTRIGQASARRSPARTAAIAAVVAAAAAAGIAMTALRQGAQASQATGPAAQATSPAVQATSPAASSPAARPPDPARGPAAAAGGTLRLDTFAKTYPPGSLPPDWVTKRFHPFFSNGEVYFYQFVDNGPNDHYLHLRSGSDNSFTVGYEPKFNVKEYPWLEWDWKMITLPKGGDVRWKERDDEAGQMCVVYGLRLTGFDTSLCYLFQEDGPKDTPIASQKQSDAHHLIIRTAKSGDPLGVWLHERRNLLEDYKRVYGHEPSELANLAIQIDSDDTHSSAEAYYRDIVLGKS